MSGITVNGANIGPGPLLNSSVNTNTVVSATDAGSYTISVGNGNNQITVGNGNNILTVGNGNSQLTLGTGMNTITVGNGNNTITVLGGENLIEAGDGSYDIWASGDAQITVEVDGNSVLLSPNGDGSYTITSGSFEVTDATGHFTISHQNLQYYQGSTQQTFRFGVESATISITSSATAPLLISLPASFNGIGEIYNQLTLAVSSGGVGPYTYDVAATGIGLNTNTFEASSFTFSPPALGDYRVTATVTDSSGSSATAIVNLRVHTINLSNFDNTYTADIDFTALKQATITDTTANTPAVDYALNGLNALVIIGADAATTFNANRVTGSSYLGASGYDNLLSYQNNITDGLTFTYNGSTETGTVTNGTQTDIISNIYHFSANGNGTTFNLTDLGNRVFNTYGGTNTFAFTLGEGDMTSDRGGNIFNLYNGGNNTFINLNTTIGDTIITHSPYDIILVGQGKVTFQDTDGSTTFSGNTIQLDNSYTIDIINSGGGNIFTLGENNAEIAITGMQGDIFNIQGTSGYQQITLNQDLGGNTFNLLGDNFGELLFLGVKNNIFNLDGTYHNIGVQATDSNNVFNLNNASNTFAIFKTPPSAPDAIFTGTINLNDTDNDNQNTIVLANESEVTLQNLQGTSAFTGQQIWLDNNDYNFEPADHTITINNDGGNNVFMINNPGSASVSGITKTFNNVINDVFNVYVSGYNFVLNNNGGGNVFSLFDPTAPNTFEGLNATTGDTISVVGNGYTFEFVGDTKVTLKTDNNAPFTGNIIQSDTDNTSLDVTFTDDGINNSILLGGQNSDATFTNVQNNTFTLSYTSDYSITLNNDDGGNIFDTKAIGGGGKGSGSGATNIVGTFNNITNDTVLIGGANRGFILNNSGGGNTFDFGFSSGAYTFTGAYQEIFDLHPYLSYEITLANDRGGNTFNLGHPGSGFLANQMQRFSGVTNDIFNLYNQGYSIEVTNNGHGNIFNLLGNGGTVTFKGLNNDTINVDNNMYSMTLEGGGTIALQQSAGASTFTGQTIQLDNNNYNITINNDGGFNTFHLSGIGFTSTFHGVNGNTFALGSSAYYTLNLEGNGSHTFQNTTNNIFNLIGNFNIALVNDGGGNTFNLMDSGYHSFSGFNENTTNIINLQNNSSNTISLQGGGNILFQDITSGWQVNNNTFSINGNYTVSIHNNGGGNTFNLTGGGEHTFTNLNNAYNAIGDTLNLDNSSYTISLGSNVIFNTFNGGEGADTFVFLGNSFGNNYIDAGTGSSNTADFSQFSIDTGATLNIDLIYNQAYLTHSNGIQLGHANTLLNFDNIVGANTQDDSSSGKQSIKLNDVSNQIDAGAGTQDTLDLRAVGNSIDLTTINPFWTHVENLLLGNQTLTINAANVQVISANSNLMLTAFSNTSASIIMSGDWTGTGSQTSVNGYTYDIYTTVASTETLLIDQNIYDRQII